MVARTLSNVASVISVIYHTKFVNSLSNVQLRADLLGYLVLIPFPLSRWGIAMPSLVLCVDNPWSVGIGGYCWACSHSRSPAMAPSVAVAVVLFPTDPPRSEASTEGEP